MVGRLQIHSCRIAHVSPLCACLAAAVVAVALAMVQAGRPAPSQRKFVSTVIDEVIANISARMKDPVLAAMFSQCYPNTLDTTVVYFNESSHGQPDTFVITGDIDAMWQRDSANQVLPYVPYAHADPHLRKMLLGVIRRQMDNVLADPYANAYNQKNSGSPHDSDYTTKLNAAGYPVDAMVPIIYERKFEIDSLAAVLRLATKYYAATGDSSFVTTTWLSGLQVLLGVLTDQQRGTYEEDTVFKHGPPYIFERVTWEPTDSLVHGRGMPASRCGLVKSAFRPSDDACLLPFFVPGNAMLAVVLEDTAAMIRAIGSSSSLADQAHALSTQIRAAIDKYGLVRDGTAETPRYAYEVDGFGSVFSMDDANVPNLLSLPYLGFVKSDDPLYTATRTYVLSSRNPFRFSGSYAQGVGSPHTPDGNVWHMSLIMQALTSQDDAEIKTCLDMLKTTTAGTLFMHESFDANDPSSFTRAWFAWANALFGELILLLAQERPYLLF